MKLIAENACIVPVSHPDQCLGRDFPGHSYKKLGDTVNIIKIANCAALAPLGPGPTTHASGRNRRTDLRCNWVVKRTCWFTHKCTQVVKKSHFNASARASMLQRALQCYCARFDSAFEVNNNTCADLRCVHVVKR